MLDPGETLTVTLSDATTTAGSATVDATAAATTIADPGTVTVSVAPASATEGEAVEFTVTLSGAVGTDVALGWSTADGSATTAGEDYTAVASGTVTVTAGMRSSTFTVTTSEDLLAEGDETFTVTLAAPGSGLPAGVSLGTAIATGTIEDDDPIVASVAPDAGSVTEGGSAEFTVTLTGGTSTASVVVTYSVTGTATSGTDYTAPSGSLTIAAGDSTGTISIPILGDDVLDPGETLTVTLSDATTTAGTATVDATAATTTIADPGTVTVSVAPASATEGEAVEFTVTLSGAVGTDVALGWSTADGSATTAGEDYTAVASGTVTVTAGMRSSTFTVTTSEDLLAEGDETFTVTLAAPGSGLPAGVSLGTAIATGTIEDDDPIEASVAADAGSVTEGGSAEFTVTLSGGTSTASVVVTYSVTGTATAGTDYTAPSGSLTIAAGESSGTITIQTTSDSVLDRGETLIVTLTGASTTAGTAEYSPTAATTTIADSGTAMVSVADARATEGDDVEFVVTLSMAAGSDVALDWSTAADTATSGDDYTAVTAGTLTISAGDTTGTLVVPTTEDVLAEADETFTVTMTGTTLPSGVTLGTANAPGTIEDDDTVMAAVTAGAPTVSEGSAASFEVVLTDATSTADVVVTYTVTGTATSGTDYTAPSGSLTITAGESSGTITIRTTSDSVLDRGETLIVTLTGASTAGTVTVDSTAATTTIVDSGTATVSVGAATAAEGDDVEFVVTLSMAAGSDVALDWSTADDTATADDDYTAVTAGTLTISAGDTTGTLTVSTAEDRLAEADETFTVTMTGTTLPSGVTLGTATATGTIEDDDTLTASVTAGASTVSEGSAASFEVVLTDATSTADVVVTYTVTGTATPGTDYTAPSGSLTITAGASSGTITIRTTSDRAGPGRDADRDPDRGEHDGGDRGVQPDRGDDHDYGPRHGDGVGGRRDGGGG